MISMKSVSKMQLIHFPSTSSNHYFYINLCMKYPYFSSNTCFLSLKMHEALVSMTVFIFIPIQLSNYPSKLLIDITPYLCRSRQFINLFSRSSSRFIPKAIMAQKNSLQPIVPDPSKSKQLYICLGLNIFLTKTKYSYDKNTLTLQNTYNSQLEKVIFYFQ